MKCFASFARCFSVATSPYTPTTRISHTRHLTLNKSCGGYYILRNMVPSLPMSKVPTTILLIVSRLFIVEGKTAPGPCGPAQSYGLTADDDAMFFIDKLTKPATDVLSCDFYSTALEVKVLKDCCREEVVMEAFLNVPMEDGPNPTNYEQIEREQIRQEALRRLPQLDAEQDMMQHFGTTELVYHQPTSYRNA